MIPNFTEAGLVEILSRHFSPSKEIDDPQRLVGRDAYLKRIRRALHSPGRHVFIYGERGVGKTSLAVTAGKIATEESKNYFYFPCGEDSSFFEIMAAIGGVALSDNAHATFGSRSFGGGVNLGGVGGASFNVSQQGTQGPTPIQSLSAAFELLRDIRNKYTGQIIIVIDELDRIKSASERRKFAELIKNTSTLVEDVRFVLCGIGANVDEIIGEHLSTGRMFEPVEVEKLNHTQLWSIIERVADELSVEIDRGYLMRIGIISDGFPHFVHLIGDCLFYALHDDEIEVDVCEVRHFQSALKDALQKAEPSLRKIYQMATEKSKNSTEYEEALWALADRTATRRQVKEIYDGSYLRINEEHNKTVRLDRTRFNTRLLTLRSDSHANIVVGYGSGWFSFRENVVRGYVRLKAETEGIELTPEVTR